MSTYDTSSPYGVKSEFKIKKETEFNAEVIMVDSNQIYFLLDGKISAINFTDIEEVYAYELESKHRNGALIFSAVSSIGLGIAFFEGSGVAAAITLGFGAGAIAGAIAKVGKNRFRPPLSQAEIGRLRLISRYPLGLDEEQLRVVIDFYNRE